ncbi:hypothetical protein [Nocardia bhagyanarayanae]|uniref:Uncharacterized protein n=1 Tax=Nocardia bhagyanarayanae TaxID=1215925 RepID=A0A543F5M1_9NOCA|nr:hypothetical protein [Nocardia bhagyanarayanae]TQM29132.1 hypothetical protein FB390_0723 [Nocardia bhagyanarayanae]
MLTAAAIAQLLIALAFVSIPLVRHRYGAAAKAAAEAELNRQGVRPGVLAEHGMRFDAGGHETWAPLFFALIMTALAALNLAGNPWGETLTWIGQALILLVNVVILYSNLTAAKGVEAAFAKTGDPELARIDVRRFLSAAEGAFPRWVMPWLQNARHAIVFGGSILVVVALVAA